MPRGSGWGKEDIGGIKRPIMASITTKLEILFLIADDSLDISLQTKRVTGPHQTSQGLDAPDLPSHLPEKRIIFHCKIILSGAQYESMEISLRQGEEPGGGRVVCVEDAQLDFVPAHL